MKGVISYEEWSNDVQKGQEPILIEKEVDEETYRDLMAIRTLKRALKGKREKEKKTNK